MEMHQSVRERLHSMQTVQFSSLGSVTPRAREKHFLVTTVIEPEFEGTAVEFVELEAVHSRRGQRVRWRELQDESVWQQGWA